MKILSIALTAMALMTFAPADVAAQGKRITSEAEFNKAVVGKRLQFGKDGDWVRVQKNGKLRGSFGGNQTVGVWQWRDTFWCRTLTKPRQNTDCQTWEAIDGGFKVSRERGKGRSFVYTLK